MNVFVYVEGPSDRSVLETLLGELIEAKQRLGISITFIPAKSGDRKVHLLEVVSRKAVDILIGKSDDHVVVMPDLYPRNKAFAHGTFDELRDGILKNFTGELRRKLSKSDPRITERFHVFCFKHDLEVLILAAAGQLEKYLDMPKLKQTWSDVVEDQNHDKPPKRIVEGVFKECGRSYVEAIDAPLILGKAKYADIADRCPQCFKPFIEFLESLKPLREL